MSVQQDGSSPPVAELCIVVHNFLSKILLGEALRDYILHFPEKIFLHFPKFLFVLHSISLLHTASMSGDIYIFDSISYHPQLAKFAQ